jgi:GT2 family glycosyltransferase
LSPTLETYPKIGIVIVTWNGKELTKDCLNSVLDCMYPNFQVTVVDNASEDGTVETLRQDFGNRIHLITNSRNLMFAGGNNVGIRHLLDQKVDWILLLNNDVEVDPGLLYALVLVGESDPNIGIVGPKIYFWEPRDLLWSAGGQISLYGTGSKHIGIRQPDQGQYDDIRDVDYVTGCALMIRRSLVEQIGLLDESYHMYNEDSDWCLRANQAGYRVVYAPEGKVWHKISSSAGGQLSLFKIRHRIRSQWIFLRKFAPWHHWFVIPFGAMAEIIRVLALAITGKFRPPTHNT